MKKIFYAHTKDVAQFKEDIEDYDYSEIKLFSNIQIIRDGMKVVKIEMDFISEGTIEEATKFVPLKKFSYEKKPTNDN